MRRPSERTSPAATSSDAALDGGGEADKFRRADGPWEKSGKFEGSDPLRSNFVGASIVHIHTSGSSLSSAFSAHSDFQQSSIIELDVRAKDHRRPSVTDQMRPTRAFQHET